METTSNAPVVVTLQLLLHASYVCHFCDLLVARSSCETPLICTLFPTQPLHDSHLYIGYLIAKIQANLARIKPTHD